MFLRTGFGFVPQLPPPPTWSRGSPTPRLCRDFTRGSCFRGDGCKFAHELPEAETRKREAEVKRKREAEVKWNAEQEATRKDEAEAKRKAQAEAENVTGEAEGVSGRGEGGVAVVEEEAEDVTETPECVTNTPRRYGVEEDVEDVTKTQEERRQEMPGFASCVLSEETFSLRCTFDCCSAEVESRPQLRVDRSRRKSMEEPTAEAAGERAARSEESGGRGESKEEPYKIPCELSEEELAAAWQEHQREQAVLQAARSEEKGGGAESMEDSEKY